MVYSLDPNSPNKWQHWSKFKTPKLATRRSIAADGTWEYRVHMKAVLHSFHPLIPNVKVWTYGNGTASDKWPGVTIEGQSNVPVRVTYVNDLVGETLSGVLDMVNRQGMEEDHMLVKSHNQVHLHGARVPWTSDGSPMHVFHPHETRGYYYPNKQAAATLWYHDHAMDATRLNVYAGLAAMYLLRDSTEAARLPTGEFEVPLVLQDRSFMPDFSKLRYEQVIDAAGTPTPEYYGEYPVVNGKIWPTMKAKQAVYRLRLVNGANARYFKLLLTTTADPGANLDFHIIGTDGGFLPTAQKINELILAPGERADILMDFTVYASGTELVLRNSDQNAGIACAELLRIQVGSEMPTLDQKQFQAGPVGTLNLPSRSDPLEDVNLAKPDNSVPPFVADSLFPQFEAAIDVALSGIMPSQFLGDGLKLITTSNIDFTFRRFVLEEYKLLMPTLLGTANQNLPIPTVLINRETGAAGDMGMPIDVAKPVKTTQNAYEVWEFVNLTPDSHPMHIHLVQFRLLSRRTLTVGIDTDPPPPKTIQAPVDGKPELGLLVRKMATAYSGSSVVQGYESAGWKDTVQCEKDQATRVLMRFDGYSGEYVYHCHILEHEDMGMMFDLIVEP